MGGDINTRRGLAGNTRFQQFLVTECTIVIYQGKEVFPASPRLVFIALISYLASNQVLQKPRTLDIYSPWHTSKVPLILRYEKSAGSCKKLDHALKLKNERILALEARYVTSRFLWINQEIKIFILRVKLRSNVQQISPNFAKHCFAAKCSAKYLAKCSVRS